MGEDLAASVLITMNLKDLGCPYIICKAQNERYKRALERVGANRVVIPEREMAVRLVRSLGSNSFLDYMELSGEYAIAEIQPPKAWLGKDLKTLNVRARYGVSVLSIIGKGSGNVRMSPGAEDVVAQGDTVMIMGKHADLDRLQKL
jgi:trk system potassium uptake protein TrkA